jgi:voltage-gated potassium channel
VPLLLLSLVFVGTYATQLSSAPARLDGGLSVVRALVWVLFAVDYLVRVRLSGAAVRYVLTHPMDLLVLVVPVLRPVLLLVAVLVRRYRLHGHAAVVRRTLVYLISVSATLVLFVATAVLLSERDAGGATIRSFPDALWWTFVTVTTVGYGDLYPVTYTGRAVAVLGMLLGIGVLGTVTATISAQVVAAAGRGPGTEGAEEVELVDLTRVLAEVQALRQELAELRGEPSVAEPAAERAAAPAPPAGPSDPPAGPPRPGAAPPDLPAG